MELSRFHNAINLIANDYTSIAIETNFKALIQNLNALVANPGNPSISQTFKDHLDAFRVALEASELNDADGDLLATLDDLSLRTYFGTGLYGRVREILEENQLRKH
jgi:hypothetical protein